MRSNEIKQEIITKEKIISKIEEEIQELKDKLQKIEIEETLEKELTTLQNIYSKKSSIYWTYSPEQIAAKEMYIRALRETLNTFYGKGYKEPLIERHSIDPLPTLMGISVKEL